MTSIEKQRVQKRRLFKGTIAVSMIYAGISFALLMIIWLSERSRGYIGESNFPFAFTFTAGMLVVIAILAYKVNTFEIKEPKGDKYDGMSCPDFWKLRETPAAELSKWDAEIGSLMKYRCVRNDTLTGSSNVVLPVGSSNVYERKLADMSLVMYGSNSDIYMTGTSVLDPTQRKLLCTSLYPQYMSVTDMKEYPDVQNALRCAYANKCNLSWSSVCPDRA